MLQALQLAPPDTQPAAPAPPTGDVVGTYRATLQPSDGGAELGDVAGEWTMELMPDGVMLVAPPATFREGASVQSGVSYSIDGERFRTNLFQQLDRRLRLGSGWRDADPDSGRGRLCAQARRSRVDALGNSVNVSLGSVL